MSITTRSLLWLEWSILFVGWPLLAWADCVRVSKFYLFAPVLIYTLVVGRRLRPPDAVFHPPEPAFWVRIPLMCSAIAAAGIWIRGEAAVAMPLERPAVWLIIMVLYPLLSALPQEYIYRRFYALRYKQLVRGPLLFWGINSVLFGFLHLMYDHWLPVVGTLLISAFFARAYAQTGRMRWAALEHALYGQTVFTFGLGYFFYEPIGAR
jgi:hypothetical protein